MNPKFLSIQGSYTHLELALFDEQQCLTTLVKDDKKASSHLIPYLQEILAECSLSLSDISFIAVDKGPGAFTSLRVIVATINGMSFANSIPLIGIDGLEALHEQVSVQLTALKDEKPDLVLVLLNAYGNDVYFYLKGLDVEVTIPAFKGYQQIDTLLDYITQTYKTEKIACVGNAVLLHEDLLRKTLQNRLLLLTPASLVASAQHIGIMGYHAWLQQVGITTQIVPNYVKTQTFAIKS